MFIKGKQMKRVCEGAESVLYYNLTEQKNKQQYLGKNFNKNIPTRFKALEK